MGRTYGDEYTFKKLKVNGGSLEDAILELGSFKGINKNYTDKKFIMQALHNQDIKTLREISNFYFKTSGIYERSAKYLANLYRYDWLLIPYIEDMSKAEKALTDFSKILKFLDDSYIPKFCADTALKVIVNGCYYGYVMDSTDSLMVQELPLDYCRSRFSVKGQPVVEFNMKYFDTAFKDAGYRAKILSVFPKEFSKGYIMYKQDKLPPQFQGDSAGWYMLDPDYAFKLTCGGGGSGDIPLLITAIPTLIDLDEAKELDRKKTMQKLLKILIQKLPIDKNGNLVFDIDEAKDLHDNARGMMRDAIGTQVLTTFAEVDMMDMSERNNSTATDELARMERAVFNELGVSQGLFNADGNLAVTNSIVNDEASIKILPQSFQQLINGVVNAHFNKNKKYYFRFKMLETTVYNYRELSKLYKEQTQIGYSKMLPQIALGHSQSEILALANFENKVLELNTIMIPPLSSNVMNSDSVLGKDGKDDKDKAANKTDTKKEQVKEEKEAGRPEKEDSQKSDKTLANKESM